jgi:hypothetical protein
MAKNLNATEFYTHVYNGREQALLDGTDRSYFVDLASSLGTSENAITAAFVACWLHNGKNVVALKNLYAFYSHAPVEIPVPPKVEDAEGELQEPKLTRSQKARLVAMTKRYNPNVTAQDCIDDLRRLEKKFPLKNITEADYMLDGEFSQDTWGRHFGSWLSFSRASELKLPLAQARYKTQVAKQVSLDVYRGYYAREVLPYANKYEMKGKGERFRTLAVASDFHDKKSRPFALGAFIDTCAEMQPNNIVLNGDLFDNYEFSRYEIDIRGCDVVAAFQFVKEHIFGALRQSCPKSQIDFVIGNHDWRILKVLAEAHPQIKTLLSGVLGLTLADVFGVHEFGINLITKWDIDFAASTKSAVEKQLRKNYKVYYDCYVAAHIKDYGFGLSGTSGHIHRATFDTSKTLAAGPLSWMTTAAICETNEDYVEGFDKSRNGFGLVYIDTKKHSVVQQIVDIPQDFTVINGRLYEAKDYNKRLA